MFARVIVDISHSRVDRLFTYSVPDGMNVCPGHRVLVPFGKGNRPVEGLIIEISEEAKTSHTVKPITKILEAYTVLLPDQIKLAAWIKNAYHCSSAEALRLMLPAQLRGGRVKEKKVRTLKISDNIQLDAARSSLLKHDGTPKAPKQLEIFDLIACCDTELSVNEINAIVPGAASAITALIKKGFITENERITFRNPFNDALIPPSPPLTLTKLQSDALKEIENAAAGSTLLLHGVTGSGKTEVYMQAAADVLKSGGGVIVLVPEISLTPQITDRFRSRFGDDIAILHSHLSSGERYDEWRRIRFGKAHIAVGARSAIFAPVENLKLIIIDEEHEPSYISEQTPKYSAVEVAIRRIKYTGAKLILGSATPALTDYYRAKRGIYKLIEMPERINGIPMPKVDVVDMREEFLSGNDGIFSELLKEKLEKCIKNKEQAILFLNRRGYSSHVQCRSCGFVFKCRNCDVALTYHKFENRLRCHYCGASVRMPEICPACGRKFIKYTGIGTQQIEEQLKLLFPDIRCLRMDSDTTTGKSAHRDIINAFLKHKADVLIGTQMVAKGLDIPSVTLVGVVFADSTLFQNDYRSSERTFQLLTQVAGRAGRAEKSGSVVIQTNAPDHRAVRFCVAHDYKSFYNLEIRDRLQTLFPPFAVFIRASFSGKDENEVCLSTQNYSDGITKRLLETLQALNAEKELIFVIPGAAPISRIQGRYRYAVIIKLVRTKNTAAAINAIYEFSDSFEDADFDGVEINPQDML